MTSVGVNVGQLTVERAMVATLRKWLPTYVVAAARRYAAEAASSVSPIEMEKWLSDYTFPFRPQSITTSTEYEDFLNATPPAIQVISPTWAPAGGDQNGRRVTFHLEVAYIGGASAKDLTRLVRACYEDAIKGLVEQHPSLGGLAEGTKTIGGGAGEFHQMSAADQVTLQGSVAVFEVTVAEVIQPFDGPDEPLPEEEGVPPEWPPDPTLDENGAEATLEPEQIGEP